MASLSLKISVTGSEATKTMQFEPSTVIFDACAIIRQKIQEANKGNANDYGLFLADEDPKKGVWLDKKHTLEYYLLRNGDLLEYKKKLRILRIRTLDGSTKTMHVDDSVPVGQLMVNICGKMGITNHDEYSLVHELADEEKEKTLTLRRDRSIAKDQKKLDEMKRKLHTDDELNWLDHSKTLREQGIEKEETLLLRRKFFFSDQNVDARDPVQLNLLYVQTRDAILKGAHPVTYEKALQFGGIQCQIQFGDHVESKHKPGFLDVKEFMPKEYVKAKGTEKKIYMEHRHLVGLAEVDAKVKYTQMARSLKTYGITFFLVKEKMKGKNKLVPRLLGITKESVVRVDEKTKEIMKTWPLTTVRRWAASPNSFTLDFGDHSDSYYSVQTTEGEQISQLIAGYIDIILKKKKANDHLGIDGNEESFTFEDQVAPAKATIIQHQSSRIGQPQMGSVALPAVLRAGETPTSPVTAGSMQKAQYTHVSMQAHTGHVPPSGQNAQLHGLGQAQRALLGTIDGGLTAVSDAQNQLEKKQALPQMGTDPASLKWRENQRDLSRQNVGAQLSAMGAATAQVVTLTSGEDDTDYNAVGSAVAAISSNVGEFAKDMRLLAALEEEDNDGDKLMDAARRLAGAFTDMLQAAQPGSNEPRQNLLNAANKIGETSHEIMRKVEEGDQADRAFQDMLLALAKAVANATAALVLKAKGVAGKCDEQEEQNRVIGSATQCALSTSQLVACTKVAAPTIHNPACQEQLIEAAKHVAKSVDNVVGTAQGSCKDDQSLADLGGAATAVTKALDDLLQHIKRGAAGGKDVQEVDIILTATDRLFSSMEDTGEMVRQARVLAQATSQLVNALKGEAESHTDSDMQKRLLAAAKQVADATAHMVEAAKGCASSPQDKSQQQRLRQAAEELRSATTSASSGALKNKIIKKLELAARNAASAATQLINASGGAGKTNSSPQSQQQLMMHCKDVADSSIPRLVHAIKGSMQRPEDTAAHMALIQASQEMLQPGGKLVTNAKAAVPTVEDQAASMALTAAAKNLSAALAELRAASGKAQDACGSMDIDGALEKVHTLEADLQQMSHTAAAGKLAPLPGESAESSATQLGAVSKSVGSSMAQLLTAAVQGNDSYTGLAARDTAEALTVLTNAVRGVAATSTDRVLQQQIIDCARDVLDKSGNLIEEARKAVNNQQNPDNQTRLAQVAKAVSQALNNCVNCLPGLRDVDDAVKNVAAVSQKLSTTNFPSSERSYQEIQITLNNNAMTLNQAATDIVGATSTSSVQHVATSSNRFGRAYEDFVDSGMEMAGVTKDTETRTSIVTSLKSVSMTSSKLLMTTKSYMADPNAPNSKNLLTQAARQVTESINHLINTCTTSAPGQKECDMALRQIQAMRPLLANPPAEPITDGSYFECLDGVIERSKLMAQAMTGISNSAKGQHHEIFCEAVRNFAGAVCGLTENSAQAAYLVGIADPTSQPGRPGLVDPSQFARALQAIQMACSNLTNPAASQQQDSRAMVLSAATVVAKHTSSLCNTCRHASSKTNNPIAKRHFVQSAKDVAFNTANLVRAIKSLDNDFSDENRGLCAEAAKPLIAAVESLTTFASNPEFAGVPAKMSPDAVGAQRPILESGKALIDGACSMVSSAKQLAIHPKDPPTYQQYAQHSHSVSEAIKQLVQAIRTSAPGQQECERAVERMTASLRRTDHAALEAISQSLAPRNDNSLTGFQEQVINAAKQMLKLIEPIRQAAKGEPEKIGHLVSKIASYLDPLCTNAIGCASKSGSSSQRQTDLLDQTKTVAESLIQLTYAAKEGGGNPKAPEHTQAGIDDTVDTVVENLHEFIANMEDQASSAGLVDSMIDNLSKSISKTEEHLPSSDNMSYTDFQTSMVQLAKKIARTAQDMTIKSGTQPADLGGLANLLTRDYGQLATDSRGAMSTTTSQEIAHRLKTAVQELGAASINLVRDAGHLQGNPGDAYCKRDLSEHARTVVEKVASVLGCLQTGARGTQACINAASTVSGIIGDLDTTIMFATAGTLNADGEEMFADHRETILKTAKALVEDTKTLVAGAASNQEQLAQAAQSAVMTITRLADCVKMGAASLGSEQPEAQTAVVTAAASQHGQERDNPCKVLLINAVKDVASALGELISATKSASGKSPHDPSMSTLKDSAKVMVTNVTSLLKTVKSVEDEAQRGTRALESSIEAIRQEIKGYVATDRVERTMTVEELIRFTKPITIATGKAVAAGNSGRQEDVIIAANSGRKAVSDLLRACKGASGNADSQELRMRLLHAGKLCSTFYQELLETIAMVISKPGPDGKQRMAKMSKEVASAVTEIIHTAEAMKGSDWIDPDDPTHIAETQLLTAANQIEAAARRLSQLKPRRQPDIDPNLNFEDQILEAARSIAGATAMLVKAASAAQTELVTQGKIGAYASNLDEDSQWSQGLVSAAQMVAAATHNLCEAANAMVQGLASEEKLISSAKQVAASTAQLLMACKVKADADSRAMLRLQSAGNAVKKATEALVHAAQKSGGNYEEEDHIDVSGLRVQGIKQIIEVQQTILEKEKELEMARRRLDVIRKAKYKDRPSDYDSGSDF